MAEYIELVDDTGRQIRKDKRGAIPAHEPRALNKLGLSADHWTRKVKGVGSGFWRVVGTLDAIEEKACWRSADFCRAGKFRRCGAWVCWSSIGVKRVVGCEDRARWGVKGECLAVIGCWRDFRPVLVFC